MSVRLFIASVPARRTFALTTSLLLALACFSAFKPALAQNNLASEYGFQPLELYKLDNRIANLTLADIDGDKIEDVIVSNNGRSRIDILFSSPKIQPDAEETDKSVNSPVYDKRMRPRRYSVNKEIVSLVTGDFNSDGRTDIAYYGTPSGLVVLANQGEGRFADPVVKTVGDAANTATGLASADLTGDGKTDLILLRDQEIVVLPQAAGGQLGEPIRIGHSATRPRLMRLGEFDGDGHTDVVIISSSDDYPLHIRFGTGTTGDGTTGKVLLGPERRLKMDQVRAIGFANLDGKPGQEMMTINNATGRGHVLKLETVVTATSNPAQNSDLASRFGAIFDYSLPPSSGLTRITQTGDLDGDGLAEVVVTDPDNARALTFRRSVKSSESLDLSVESPSLIEVRSMKVADLDGDKKAEVYVLSSKEKQIGRGVWQQNRLSFPRALPITGGEPVAMEVADIDGDTRPELIYVTKSTTAGKDQLHLHALRSDAKGAFSATAWPGGVAQVSLKEGLGNLEDLQAVDVNNDGLDDLLILTGYGNPVLYLSRKAGPPQELTNLGPLASANRRSVRSMNLDGQKVLMVAQNNFVRVVGLDAENRWQIRDQFNASGASASIAGVTTLNLDQNAKSDLAMYDQDTKSIEILLRDDTGTKSAGLVSLGNLEFQGLRSVDLGGDSRPDLLIEASNRFATLVLGARAFQVKTLASYEATDRRSRLGDVVAADLGGPASQDIAWVDVGDHSIQITAVDNPASGEMQLRRAISFKVFEEKSFRDVRSLGEPRDVSAGDVDGDKLADLVLIAHDRIIIYRQDSGTSPAPPAARPAAAGNNPAPARVSSRAAQGTGR
ncbi:MAG: FG-GAP repeat domain-containing protein [bacterium]